MAYNNGFPVGYPQYFPQYQVQQPVMPQQAQQTAPTPTPQNNGIVWVQGEAAARSYLLAPNTTLPLWDSESKTIFLKSTDAAGMPSMKILDYTIRDSMPTSTPVSAPVSKPVTVDYATKAEVEALYSQIRMLKDELESITSRKPASKKKEGGNDE